MEPTRPSRWAAALVWYSRTVVASTDTPVSPRSLMAEMTSMSTSWAKIYSCWLIS